LVEGAKTGVMSKHGIPFALKDGKVVSISEVERGLKCGAQCPQCSAPLVAKKGNINAHHFAHNLDSNCKGAFETAIHLAAKDIVMKNNSIIVHGKEAMRNELFYNAVCSEKKIGKYIPDTVIEVYGRQSLIQEDYIVNGVEFKENTPVGTKITERQLMWVEIKVTHGIEDYKTEHIIKNKINCIEVDLSNCRRDITKKELTDKVLFDHSNKRLVYYWLDEVVKEIIEQVRREEANKELQEFERRMKVKKAEQKRLFEKRRAIIERRREKEKSLPQKQFFLHNNKIKDDELSKLMAMIRICKRNSEKLTGRAKAAEIETIQRLERKLKQITS
jgi:hypothetical protein